METYGSPTPCIDTRPNARLVVYWASYIGYAGRQGEDRHSLATLRIT